MIDQTPRHDCLIVAKTTAVMFRRLMEYYDPDEADTWLNTAHPHLAGQKPIALIAAERGGEVYAILEALIPIEKHKETREVKDAE